MITVAFIEEDSGEFDRVAFTEAYAHSSRDGFGTSTRLVLERGLGATRLLRRNARPSLFDALSARRAIAVREHFVELP